MHVDDYRFFITRIKELEAESAGLKRIMELERASFDLLSLEIASADKAARSERAAAHERITYLESGIRRHKRSAYYPGIILGGGPSRDGGFQAFGGIGWKIDLW